MLNNIKIDTFDDAGQKTVSYKAYENDDGISKPTEEQYENSKKMKAMLADWLHRSKKLQEELLDELFEERLVKRSLRGGQKARQGREHIVKDALRDDDMNVITLEWQPSMTDLSRLSTYNGVLHNRV